MYGTHVLATVSLNFFVNEFSGCNLIFFLLCVLGDWKFNIWNENETSNPNRVLSHFCLLHAPLLTWLQFVWLLYWHHSLMYPWAELSKCATGRGFECSHECIYIYIFIYIHIFIFVSSVANYYICWHRKLLFLYPN